MKHKLASLCAITALAVAGPSSSVARGTPGRVPAPRPSAEGSRLLGGLPVAFVPNVGQWEHAARYVARVGAMTVFLEENGWTVALAEPAKEHARGVAVRMTFAGARAPTLVAEDTLPGRHNYFLGDPAQWRSDVPLYRSVRYRDVQPGVDVRAREHAGHFEYDLLLQPGADLAPVEIAVEGIERMRVDTDGALVFETHIGPVRMPVPLSWEVGPAGEQQPIACRYALRGTNRFGFEAPGRQPGWALVVDPGLVWSTFVGGTGYEYAYALALDDQGVVTIAGSTGSADFPTTPGAFDLTFNGGGLPLPADVFVTRLAPDGASLVWSTFLGGTGNETAYALAVDAQGAATITGSTDSADFPTTLGAFDTSFNGGAFTTDAFVARLSSTGASLVWSTFLGGAANDVAFALALDTAGAVTLAGQTSSVGFPTTAGAFDQSYNGGTLYNGDAFVARLTPTGASLWYSTFLGGTGDDAAYALAVDAQGAATVAGGTAAADFPTTAGAFDRTFNGGNSPGDAFVTKLAPTGASLVYSTFLGGSNEDYAFALALDAQGAATVAGSTGSIDFPITFGAFDASLSGTSDGFVARLAPTGASLGASTFLGGLGNERVNALALDPRGAATVAGSTSSADFPTTPGAFDTTYNGPTTQGGDAFVARLSPTLASLTYSTFLGGAFYENVNAMALDARGEAVVAGNTSSADFPTTVGAFDTTHNGGTYDAFVTRLDMLPTGVETFGRSSPGCGGALAIGVTSMPQLGNTGFALTCGNATPNASGILALTGHRLASPFPLLGVEVWVDPTLAFVQVFVQSNGIGASEVAMPIANLPWLSGVRLFAQFFWAGPSVPLPCPPLGLSASNGLGFTVQP